MSLVSREGARRIARLFSSLRVALVIAAAVLALPLVIASAARTHIVQPGESLSLIADNYGVSMDALIRENNINDPDRIHAGQVLRISQTVSPVVRVHVVEQGDTLAWISTHYRVSVGALIEANAMKNPDLIEVGQVLSVPPSPDGIPEAIGQDQARQLLIASADEFALPRGLLLGLAWIESGWQQHVVSSASAVGLLQVTPDTGDWAVEFLLPSAANWRISAQDNARVGGAILRNMIDQANGDIPLALAFYYQGWRSIERFGLFQETREYVSNVLFYTAKYS
jgi:LysM repeat protein